MLLHAVEQKNAIKILFLMRFYYWKLFVYVYKCKKILFYRRIYNVNTKSICYSLITDPAISLTILYLNIYFIKVRCIIIKPLLIMCLVTSSVPASKNTPSRLSCIIPVVFQTDLHPRNFEMHFFFVLFLFFVFFILKIKRTSPSFLSFQFLYTTKKNHDREFNKIFRI